MSGNLDEAAFATKNIEIRDRLANLKLQLEVTDRGVAEKADVDLKVFKLGSERYKSLYSDEKALQRAR